MPHSSDFHRHILDSVTDNICVINKHGEIVYTNQAWREFAAENGAPRDTDFQGVNYISVCEQTENNEALKGILRVISGEADCFSYEYPCHSPSQQRWFLMRITPLARDDHEYFVISHQNITLRRLAEEQAQWLARTDPLTTLANRRSFDNQLAAEWKRSKREGFPLSLAFIDIDYFKEINDTNGHPAGDQCLERVAALLKDYAKRPGDCCARYGGDEFALLLTYTSLEAAEKLLATLPDKVRQLQIPNASAPTGPFLTVSVGLSGGVAMGSSQESLLLRSADILAYKAKSMGRNTLCAGAILTDSKDSPDKVVADTTGIASNQN